MTFEEIKNNPEINTFIQTADDYLAKIGYTNHSYIHIFRVVSVTEYILSSLGYDEHTIMLGKIAAFMHDIGNVINRDGHAKTGALMSYQILDKLGFSPEDISRVILAIGNHDESSAYPVSEIASALILADKTDVRRSRVRGNDVAHFPIHSRVNYAVEESKVSIDKEEKTILLKLKIDTQYCSIMEYFEIFISRMVLCKQAAHFFDLTFKLQINDQYLI